MRSTNEISRKVSEKGVALLLALIALLVISAIGVSLLLTSGIESSLAANYRTSTQAFYGAMAGLEEGRGRLWSRSPNVFPAAFIPLPNQGTVPPFFVLPVGQVRYVLNPGPGETNATVNPLGATYPDNEYGTEFGLPPAPCTAAPPGPPPLVNAQAINSVWQGAALSGPVYKWVRINAVTEQAIRQDVNGDTICDNALPLWYTFNPGRNLPTLTLTPPTAVTFQESQALEITALAVLPNGSRRMLQYVVAPVNFNLSFPSAMTFDGNNDTYSSANSNVFFMNGNDQQGGGPVCGPPAPPVPAMGVLNNPDINQVANAVPPARADHYTGAVLPPPSSNLPSVGNISGSMSGNLQTVSGLDDPNASPPGLVQQIAAAADYVIPGPVGNLPDFGTATSPVVTVVQGDLSLGGNTTGYGILVVTGNFTFSGNTSWNGVVLVVGQGKMTESGGGNGQFNGAVLLANTRGPCPTNDWSCPLLPNPGPVTLDWAGGGGNGVYYNTCMINNTQNQSKYRVISFREIEPIP